MPKFTLIAEHTDLQGNPDGTKVTYECYVDVLDDVLEHFDLFVRGCGYNPTGTLDYIDYDSIVHPTPLGEDILDTFMGDGHDGMGSTMEDYPELYDSKEVLGKSNHYFDMERNK